MRYGSLLLAAQKERVTAVNLKDGWWCVAPPQTSEVLQPLAMSIEAAAILAWRVKTLHVVAQRHVVAYGLADDPGGFPAETYEFDMSIGDGDTPFTSERQLANENARFFGSARGLVYHDPDSLEDFYSGCGCGFFPQMLWRAGSALSPDHVTPSYGVSFDEIDAFFVSVALTINGYPGFDPSPTDTYIYTAYPPGTGTLRLNDRTGTEIAVDLPLFQQLGTGTEVHEITCSVEITAVEYWEYRDKDGANPIWDKFTGAQLIDPVPRGFSL